MSHTRLWRTGIAGAASVPILALAACSGGGDAGTLTLAHSFTDNQPQHRCGAQVIADAIDDAGVDLQVEIFGNSQLGGDADRIASVASGDIDIDLQGASALGAVHDPISAVDAVYAFDDADHLARYFAGEESEDLKESFLDETGVHILGAWSAGDRQFTSNTPIRTPDDLDGLRVRFPNSPQFLMNARALGANPTEVAYEEIYLALQQGTVDGQENPITNISALNLAEVQDYVSLTGHQANSNLVIVGDVWDELSGEQQTALQDAIDAAVEEVPQCVAEDEAEQIEEWNAGDEVEVVDDVDVDTFSSQAEDYLRDNFTPEQLEVYESIRAAAE